MLSKRTLKKISIIVGIAIIVLWFGGNLGLYYFVKYSVLSNPTIKETINNTPEKLKIVESDIKAEYLHLMGFKLKFPFYKKDMKYVSPTFIDGKLWSISIFFKKDDSDMTFISFQDYEFINNIEKSSRKVEYARFKEFSWWNLFHNLRLSSLLILKAISSADYQKKAYDLETPFVKGILHDFMLNKAGRFFYEFNFGWDDKSYSFDALGLDKEKNTIKDIISTMQRVDDIEASYKKMEILYNNKEKSRYPEELLLLSMISLKGANEDNLKELLKIMEDKQYKPDFMETLKEAIEYK